MISMVTRLALTVVLWLFAAPPVAEAQESTTRPRVGFVGAESPSTNQHFLDAFRQGLREHGYVDGQNVTIEARWADGRSDRFPELIGELVQLNTRVILTVSLPAALAAKNLTTATPIVFIASDPLGAGLVAGLARPGGNVTGFSLFLGEEFSSKWLELLREVMPKVSRVAVLLNRANPASVGYLRVLQGTAQTLGIDSSFRTYGTLASSMVPSRRWLQSARRPSSWWLTR